MADINERYVEGLTFHFVDDVQDVLRFALLDEKVQNAVELTVPADEALPQDRGPESSVSVRLMKGK